MSHGYSVHLVNLNKQADKKSLGAKLGRVCIAENIPVSVVAAELNISRQTVYNWFAGLVEPSKDRTKRIQAFIKKVTR